VGAIRENPRLEPTQELRHLAQPSGLDVALQPADQRGQRFRLADPGAGQLTERQVHADELLQVQLPGDIDGDAVRGHAHEPVGRQRPVGLEVVAMRQEHRFAGVAHQIQVRIDEVERQLPALGSDAAAARLDAGNVVQKQIAVLGPIVVPLRLGRHARQHQALGRVVSAIVDHTRYRPLERPRQLALLQLVDDVDLVLDDVPDVEVVVPRDVDQLTGQAIGLQRGEEHLGMPIRLLEAGDREVQQIAEEDDVVGPADGPGERWIGRPQLRGTLRRLDDEGAEVVAEMRIRENRNSHCVFVEKRVIDGNGNPINTGCRC
jgi:hypothetical protein